MSVRESMSVALVSAQLADRDGDAATPVMRVRAFGAAQIARQGGVRQAGGVLPWIHADGAGGVVVDGAVRAEVRPEAIDPVIEPPRVAALMWRAKYARDLAAAKALVPALRQVLQREAQGRWPNLASSALFVRVAGQIADEWLHDRCKACHGRGIVPTQRHLSRLHALPRGTRMRECASCRGGGLRRVADAERAQAIGVSTEVYRQHWAALFVFCQERTVNFDVRFAGRLRKQLWVR